ncbi:hypothetical protein D3C71_2113600 [compost metagenome]
MSRTPSLSSSLCTSLLTAEGVMQQTFAAAEKPPSSTALAKTAISPERLIDKRDM